MRGNFYRRGTLLIPSGPIDDPERMHLHIIMTNPDDDGMQLVVSVSTLRAQTRDRTCILKQHEHAFIKHDSFVDYSLTTLEEHDEMRDGVARRIFFPKADLNAQVFLRVARGIDASPRTPRKLKEYFINAQVAPAIARRRLRPGAAGGAGLSAGLA